MLGVKRYGQVQGTTASKEELLALLFEGALKNIRLGIAALEARKPGEAAKPLLKATEIVRYLLSTLDTRQAPELCQNLGRAYVFICSQLTVASLKANVVAARQAEAALAPIAASFTQVLRKAG